MRVRVSLPGGNIAGELRDRTEVQLSFAPGSYYRYGERELERHLASIAKLLWAGRMKEYYAAVSEAFGETITGEPRPVSPRDQDYYSARDDLIAEGRSSDGRIYVAVRGMQIWTVRIADGTVRALDEDEFAVRAREAAARLIRDQLTKIRALKDRFYG
jgi:hypothetical protein